MVRFNFGNLFGNILHLAHQQIVHDAPPNPNIIADFLSDLSDHFRRVPTEGEGDDITEENHHEASTNSIIEADAGAASKIGNGVDLTTSEEISTPENEVSKNTTEDLVATDSDAPMSAINNSPSSNKPETPKDNESSSYSKFPKTAGIEADDNISCTINTSPSSDKS